MYSPVDIKPTESLHFSRQMLLEERQQCLRQWRQMSISDPIYQLFFKNMYLMTNEPSKLLQPQQEECVGRCSPMSLGRDAFCELGFNTDSGVHMTQ